MSAFASFNGVRVVFGTLTVPLVGLWTASLSLATGDAVDTTGPLVLGNLTLRGSVVRQSVFNGARSVLLVAGAGGWRKSVGKQHYANDGGVQLSTILGDAAREVGESVNVADDATLPGYVRRAGPASVPLVELAGDGYHVDPAGVTQIGAWPSALVQSPYTVTEHSGGAGFVEIATEDYAAHLPGSRLESPFLDAPVTNGGMVLRIGRDDVWRVTVMSGAA